MNPHIWKWIRCSIGLAAIAWLSLEFYRAEFPRYAGHSAADWFNHLNSVGDAEAFEALKALGPRGAPAVLRGIGRNYSPAAVRFAQARERLPYFLRRYVPKPKAALRHPAGPQESRLISAAGPTIIPLLIRALHHSNPELRAFVAEALGHLYPKNGEERKNVLRELTNAGRDRDTRVRYQAISAIGILGHEREAVSVLLHALAEGEDDSLNEVMPLPIHSEAARLLGLASSNAQSALASLRLLLRETTFVDDHATRTAIQAAIAIGQISGKPETIAPFLWRLVFSRPVESWKSAVLSQFLQKWPSLVTSDQFAITILLSLKVPCF